MLYIVGILIGIYIGVLSHDGDGYLLGGIVGFLIAQIIKLKDQISKLENLIKSKSLSSTPVSKGAENLDTKISTSKYSAETNPNLNQDKAGNYAKSAVDESLEPEKSITISQSILEANVISQDFKATIEENELTSHELESIEKQLEELTKPSEVIESIEDARKFDFSNDFQSMPAHEFQDKVQKSKSSPNQASMFDQILSKTKNYIVAYFTGGNLIVRIGLLVLFVGVAFLLKYVAERTTVPVEFRYIGISVGCLVMLLLGWKLRLKRPGYAISLLGGGIGVLYLTLFAAMRIHALLSAHVVIILLIVIVILSAILALLSNSMALAVIGMIGGYAAPVLTSTGSGSHVQLFSYYLLLNFGVFFIAWFKSWRILNVLGFVATFGIGSLWGYKYYIPEHLWSVEPFLIANFLMYTSIALLFAIKQKPNLKGLNDATLIFGTPLVGFSLQAGLMQEIEYGLAYSALILGSFYMLLSYLVHKFNKPYLKSLIESFIALGIGFATLAIPLGFDGRVTSAMWVAEGSALVWVGIRQARLLPRFSGYALTIIGSISFFTETNSNIELMAWLNADYIGILIIVAATAFIGFYARANANKLLKIETPLVPRFMLVFSLFWWVFGGVREINLFYYDIRFSLIQLFLVLTTLAVLMIADKIKSNVFKLCGIIIALAMLIVLDVIPNNNTEDTPLLNNRFLGLMIVAISHFVLSWYWRAEKHNQEKIGYKYFQPLFLATSLLTWFYAFVTELRFYYSVDEFLLIELLMATTSLLLLSFGIIKNNIQYKLASIAISLMMFIPMKYAPLGNSQHQAVLNISFLGYLVYTLTQLSMSWYWQLKSNLQNPTTKKWSQSVSNIMLFVGLMAWFLRGMYELDIYLSTDFIINGDLIFIIVSTLVFVLLAHQLNWKYLHSIKYTYLPLLLGTAIIVLISVRTFHQSYGIYVWLFAALFNYWLLRIYHKSDFKFLNLYHIVALFIFSFIAVFEFAELIKYVLNKSTIWHKASYTFMLSFICIALYSSRKLNKWPLNHFYQAYIKTSLPILVMISWLMMLLLNLSPPGGLNQIIYLPVLNLIDVAGLMTLLLTWKMLVNDAQAFFTDNKKPILILIASLSFILINASMLRCFHYWFELAYKWSTMWPSFMVQTGLSILWTLTAMVLMIVSAKKKWRIVWLLGLGLIILVVLKLFLVDMSASGTIERIVAFLTVGILLSVVGYFSPIPPEDNLETLPKSIKEKA